MGQVKPSKLIEHQQLMRNLRAAKLEQDRNERQAMATMIVLMPSDHADRAIELLGSSAQELPQEGDKRVIEWRTGTSRRGDDETIVVTLSHTLPDLPWSIDWQRSDY